MAMLTGDWLMIGYAILCSMCCLTVLSVGTAISNSIVALLMSVAATLATVS